MIDLRHKSAEFSFCYDSFLSPNVTISMRKFSLKITKYQRRLLKDSCKLDRWRLIDEKNLRERPDQEGLTVKCKSQSIKR